MASTTTVKLLWILCVALTSGQILELPEMPNNGICMSLLINNTGDLRKLYKCVVVMGNLQVVLMENTKNMDFQNITFPNLREVTGFMVAYRVRGLQSLGKLFPNLSRIRGNTLFYDYALVIYDMPSLLEIGLYNLIKIDRGGVMIWGDAGTCYIDTIDWQALAPNARHYIKSIDRLSHCNNTCNCSSTASYNHCWNSRKCQRYIEGPEAESCNPQCLECRNNYSNICTSCKNYTYKNRCISKCPDKTVVLPANQYCLSSEECKNLRGWTFNNSCVFDCPVDYVRSNNNGSISCVKCANCQKTCRNLMIQNLKTVQDAEKCVFVNGSLIIHLRAVPYFMEELRKYLSKIEQVSDYIMIYGSTGVTSLNFLPSLRRIGGLKLNMGKYSLVVHDMESIHTLFTPEVTEKLIVDRGTLRILNNPKLCSNLINNLKVRFPVKPTDDDISEGLNGYDGDCLKLDFEVNVINATSALLTFLPLSDFTVAYTVLYARLAYKVNITFEPESCSQTEWSYLSIDDRLRKLGRIELTHLIPASNYALCIETFRFDDNILARTKVIHFTTAVGKPEPPFISQLAARSSQKVFMRWIDHDLFRKHITHYELDIKLVEIDTKDVLLRDHCSNINDKVVVETHRHMRVMKPPLHYERGCRSVCGIYSSQKTGALADIHFDICNALEHGCDTSESKPPSNTTYKGFVKTLFLNISAPNTVLNITGLAPYTDYRLRLRSCFGLLCSRSARSIIRTLAIKSEIVDRPKLLSGTSYDDGVVFVKWDHPEITNGPVLSYVIEIKPAIMASNDVGHQVLCVSSNVTKVAVKSEISNKYLVKVCSTTLAFTYACSDEIVIRVATVDSPSWWWNGVIFGVILYVVSFLIGYLWRSRVHNVTEYNDDIPLVYFTSDYRNESVPPVVFSDFSPLYLVQLNNE